MLKGRADAATSRLSKSGGDEAFTLPKRFVDPKKSGHSGALPTPLVPRKRLKLAKPRSENKVLVTVRIPG